MCSFTISFGLGIDALLYRLCIFLLDIITGRRSPCVHREASAYLKLLLMVLMMAHDELSM